MIEDDELHVLLAKPLKAEVWDCVFKGHAVSVLEKEDMKKKLMLERFQEENPGFDFSDAQFNGNVPNPKDFMGGIGYK